MTTKSEKGWFARNPVIVLLLAVAIAIGTWYWWLGKGIRFAHERVGTYASEVAVQSNGRPARVSLPATAPVQAAAPEQPGAVGAPVTRSDVFAEVGQTGDTFGGLNALMTAIAGALVFWAGFMQSLSLREARENGAEERISRQRQEFESLFFRMLDMARDLTDRIEWRETAANQDGADQAERPAPSGDKAMMRYVRSVFTNEGLKQYEQVLDSIHTDTPEEIQANEAAKEYNKKAAVQNMSILVERYRKNVYEKHPSAFGPYFRLLFQTFKHVNEYAGDEKEKTQYANIARGQMSENAVMLLALNGLTKYGYDFIFYIERFGLLKHRPSEYEWFYRQAFQSGYRETAFMGSEERKGKNVPKIPMKRSTFFEEKNY